MLLRPMCWTSSNREAACISNFVLIPERLYDTLAEVSIPNMNKLTFSFDIGYASIGWSVIENTADKEEAPRVKAAGVVIFGADDCLASERRAYRRMRRTIRARRKRIARMAQILSHSGLLSREELAAPGHPAPFWLAARALQGKARLSLLETWHILRWYAHNRGYDGNTLWTNDQGKVSEEEQEDAKRVSAAKKAMAQYGTSSMAETITAFLGLNTEAAAADFTVASPKYRQCNWAFPRGDVEREVQNIISNSPLPASVANLLLKEAALQSEELAACGVILPRRYRGSVLFGQLVPRFDNRIIARCPITWESEYRSSLEAGKSESDARRQADKMAKVPKADCPEFYRYRFARILANLREHGEPLSAALRQTLMQEAVRAKKLTKTSFRKLLSRHIDIKSSNFDNYFDLVDSADKALILVPEKDSRDKASGRAPYARPVLRRVIDEILRGEDPCKPARSLLHPEGEEKAQDGTLYCIADPNSEVNRHLAARSLDSQTNNPLVRHRLLILGRLVREMIERYAGGDPAQVSHCCIEVGREVRSYAGLSNKAIKIKESEKMQSFHAAVSYYEKLRGESGGDSLPPLNANLIRKCRIALDMDWKCPFTGMQYSARDLPYLEKEHIIPRSDRRTDSMAALVLTFREVNNFKNKRTALQFIRECGGQSVPGAPHLTILKEAEYTELVKNLRVSKNPNDKSRTATRKKLLMTERFGENNQVTAFTEGQMTQSSQLMRLAARVVRRCAPQVTVAMIPGRVTAELRRSWKLFGCLDAAAARNGTAPAENFKDLSKEDIRSRTHLHHAIDAAALGLARILIPGGTNGRVWNALISRRLSEQDEQALRDNLRPGLYSITPKHQLQLNNVPQETLDTLSAALAENRVVQHIPADMSGAKLEANYKRILGVGKEKGKEIVRLKKRPESEEAKRKKAKRRAKSGNTKERKVKPYDAPPLSKIIGLREDSKLRPMKAALVIEKNYAIALDPEPTLIRHHRVYKQLAERRRQNGGKPVRLLRAGDLIRLPSSPRHPEREGLWRIVSIKESTNDGLLVDMQRPSSARPLETHPDNWINVSVNTLLRIGAEILAHRYTGDF